MKLCPLKHENTDESKFCETCGTRILDPLPPTSSVPQPPAQDAFPTSDPVSQPTTLDLDLMTDDSDDHANDDIEDVDIVLTDDTSIAAVTNTDADDDDDSNSSDDEDSDSDSDDSSDDENSDSDSDDSSDDENSDSDDSSDDNYLDDDADDDDSLVQPVATYLTTSAPAVTTAVAEMNNWAKQWDVSTDPYVKGLNEAIQQNSDLGMWSSLDPTQLLPDMPDQTTIFHRLGSGLALLRNVLVFLPVAITWQAIAKATEAYTTWFPEADEDLVGTTKNFLDFWADGKGVLDNKYTLPHIGILDFWIIIAIIVISLIASGLTARGDKANEDLRQVFESERLTIAIRIRRALHGKREASPESIATSLADALADLNQTTRDMAAVAARLEATTTGVMALTPQIERLNDHAGTFAVQTSTAIAQAVQQLVASVDSLNGSVSNNITNAFQTAVSSLQEVGEEMKRHATSVEYGTKLLKDDIEAIRKGLRR